MAICTEVKRWIEEEIQVPAESYVTLATKACTEYKQRVEQTVRKPIEKWVARQERKCKKRKWYDPRRWVCTIVNALVKIVTWVLVVIVKWIPYLVCKVVTNVVKILTMIVVRVLKFIGTFLTCIFTDPLEALKSFRDLWNDILDIFAEIVEFLKSFLDDVADLITDVERLTDSLGCSFGFVGTFLGGIVKWIAGRGREAAALVHDLVNNVLRLVLGALGLNWCRAADGLLGIGADIVRAVVWVLSIPAGSGGGLRDTIRMNDLEKMIEGRLQTATDDEELREKARERIGLGSCPFGLPFTIEPCRFYLSSRPSPSDDRRFQPVDLRALHNSGVIDLYELAGFISGCDGLSSLWDKDKISRRWRAEVVYAGTTTPVSYRDLDLFLSDGPDAVAEFRVYPIPLHAFDRYLKLAKRKGHSIGVELQWDRVQDFEWQSVSAADPIGIPDNAQGQSILFDRYGRLAARGDICTIPAFAGFRYIGNSSRRGFTSAFPSPITSVDLSGVTFRDSLPEFFFQWVLIHELGHYFSLQHDGHDGFGHIMWTPDPAAQLETWTAESVVEFFLSGEPQFTSDDAFRTWSWILTNAWTCLFGEERPPVIL